MSRSRIRPLYVALAALLVAFAFVPSCGRKGPGSRDRVGCLTGRDFVLVVADSFDAAHASVQGYDRATTPFLESLAERGVRAAQARSQTSWTLSSVASLFTGKLQESHGVLQPDHVLRDDAGRTLAEMFRDAGYRTVALVENAVAGPGRGLERGFERYDYVRFQGEDGPLATIERAHALLDDGDERPTFLYVHMLPPHMPYRPPIPYIGRFSGKGEGTTIRGTIHDVSRVQAQERSTGHPDTLRLAALYDDHVAYADHRIGALLEPLLAPARAEGVAVLVTSDHGEAFMQHGRTGHNSTVYEEMVRVPWILVAPGALEGGVTLPNAVSLLDSLPTMAELFDLPVGASVDGRSVAAWLDGSDVGSAREHYLSSRYPQGGSAAQFAWIEGDWKLVTRRRGLAPQLFHLADDPNERNDLFDAEIERAKRMGEKLAAKRRRLAETNADSLSAPLEQTMIRDIQALGYGGTEYDPKDDR